MRLALAFGRTATELETALPQREWVEWQMFIAEEPIGEARQDWRIAVLTALLANINRGNSPAFSARDFVYMPELRQTAPQESLADIAKAWGAT